MCDTRTTGALDVHPLPAGGRGRRLLPASSAATRSRWKRARRRALRAGGIAAGTNEAAPLHRGQPAQTLRHADLRRRGLLRPAAVAWRCGRVLQGAAEGAWWQAVSLRLGAGVAPG